MKQEQMFTEFNRLVLLISLRYSNFGTFNVSEETGFLVSETNYTLLMNYEHY